MLGKQVNTVKISPGQVSNVLKSYRKQAGEKIGEKQDFKASLKKADKTQVSDEARLFQAAFQKLKNMPDVREEKVADIKKSVDSGTYQVSGKEIVEKMVERVIVDKLV